LKGLLKSIFKDFEGLLNTFKRPLNDLLRRNLIRTDRRVYELEIKLAMAMLDGECNKAP